MSIYSRPNSDANTNDWYDSKGAFSGKNANLVEADNQPGFQFGDADPSQKQPYDGSFQWAKSAYLNKKVFGAMLKGEHGRVQDKVFSSDGKLIEDRNADNVGALVSWDTIDEKDRDFISDNTTEPSLEYMSWGVWGMAMTDSQGTELSGFQSSSVHLGTWFAGDLLDVTDWPISRTATLAGMAMFDVFARIEESGVTNSYHWTEGAGASGSVVFDGSGDYQIDITVNNLGSGAHGSGFTSQMLNGAAGSITWSASGNSGSPNFSGQISTSTFGSEIIKNQKYMGRAIRS